MAKVISDDDAHRAWKATLSGTRLPLPGGDEIALEELTDGVASGYGGVALVMSMLESSGAWSGFIKSAPVNGESHRATKTEDLMKTMLACVLIGGNRYLHVEHIKRDYLLAELMKAQFCSSDSLGRGLARLAPRGGIDWAAKQLLNSALPLLRLVPGWVMDLDTTVKTLYGLQEGAEVGYNPHKKGHRGHALHIVSVGGARLILQVQVLPGNQMTPSFGRDQVMALLDRLLAEEAAPRLVRGDVAYGSDEMMKCLESRDVDYLFRLKMSKRVSELCRSVLERRVGWEVNWQDCGKGYRGCEAELQLQGWEQPRRVIIMARPKVRKPVLPPAITDTQAPPPAAELLPPPKPSRRRKERPVAEEPQQLVLDLRFDEPSNCFVTRDGQSLKSKGALSTRIAPLRTDLVAEDPEGFEFMVLVTSLRDPFPQIAQEYRQRADSENPHDQLKNQQALGGFTSDSLDTTRMAMILVALFHNWWTIFARAVDPDKTTEQITGQPAIIATPVLKTQPRGGNPPRLRFGPVGNHPLLMLGVVAAIVFFSGIKASASQNRLQSKNNSSGWAAVCAHSFKKYISPINGGDTGESPPINRPSS